MEKQDADGQRGAARCVDDGSFDVCVLGHKRVLGIMKGLMFLEGVIKEGWFSLPQLRKGSCAFAVLATAYDTTRIYTHWQPET